MKVTTEGCLFGARIEVQGTEKSILDIGTGTGLLALMLAQRSRATITAVEVDGKSASEATTNFAGSPWKSRLHCIHQSIQEYASEETEKFDLIVSNPPFFSNHKKSDSAKDVAIHDDHLNQEELVTAVRSLLSESGRFWVMYPTYEFQLFKAVCINKGFSCANETRVLNKAGLPPLRTIGMFQRETSPKVEDQLVIRDGSGHYTQELQDLLREFYL